MRERDRNALAHSAGRGLHSRDRRSFCFILFCEYDLPTLFARLQDGTALQAHAHTMKRGYSERRDRRYGHVCDGTKCVRCARDALLRRPRDITHQNEPQRRAENQPWASSARETKRLCTTPCCKSGNDAGHKQVLQITMLVEMEFVIS